MAYRILTLNQTTVAVPATLSIRYLDSRGFVIAEDSQYGVVISPGAKVVRGRSLLNPTVAKDLATFEAVFSYSR